MSEQPDLDKMRAGASLVYMHTPRGGYGHTHPTDATFVRCTSQERATVRLRKSDGTVVTRSVLVRNLCLPSARRGELGITLDGRIA